MIRRPAGCLGVDPAEPKPGQIEFINKNVDHANRIVLADPVIKAFGKQRALPAIHALTKRLIRSSRKSPSNHTAGITSSSAFSHSQGQTQTSEYVRLTSAHRSGPVIATDSWNHKRTSPEICITRPETPRSAQKLPLFSRK